MDGRHDFSSLERSRLFQHPLHPGHHPGHHPPGPTPPPPPLLSPGYPESGSSGLGAGLGAGLARQSLVELARNAATPGGSHGYGQSRYLPSGLPGPLSSLHPPRSSYQTSLMSPYHQAGAGGGGAGSGGGPGGSGPGPSSSGSGPGQTADTAAYKSMLSASGISPHFWPPPPPSPHGAPTGEGVSRHGLAPGLYPGFLPLLPGAADTMAGLFPSSTSPMSQAMHPYHRIYELHKEAFMAGGMGTTSSVSSASDNPLFAFPHSSCSASCYSTGCSRVSMSATLELQEQARALHYHLQQQQLHAQLQEEREDWERGRAREEQEREEKERLGKEKEEKDIRERESPVRPHSSSGRKRGSPDGSGGGRGAKECEGKAMSGERHQSSYHQHHHHHHSQQSQQLQREVKEQHNQKQSKSSLGVGVVSPSKAKGDVTGGGLKVAEVSGLQRQQAASGTAMPTHVDNGEQVVKHRAKKASGVSNKEPDVEKGSSRDESKDGGSAEQRDSKHAKKSDGADEQSLQSGTTLSGTTPSGTTLSGTTQSGTSGTTLASPSMPHLPRKDALINGVAKQSDSVATVKIEPQPRLPEGDQKATKGEGEEATVSDVKHSKSPSPQAAVLLAPVKSLATQLQGEESATEQRTLAEDTSSVTAKPHIVVVPAPQQPKDPTEQSAKPMDTTPTSTANDAPTPALAAKCPPPSQAPSRSTAPQSMVCLKKQLTESIPSDILSGGVRSQRLVVDAATTTPTPAVQSGKAPTSRHDPPRPVLTSALQATRRLLHSPESILVPSSSSPMMSPTSSVSKRQPVTTTTSTVSMTKMTPNLTVVTSSSPDGGVYAMYPSTKPVSMVCLPTGVTASSGESSSALTRTSASHRALGTISYSHHISGNLPQEMTGPRKVHATTFTPEVGTVHQGPITSPVSMVSNNSNSSSNSSTSPTHGEHKRGGDRSATQNAGRGATLHHTSTNFQDVGRNQGRPCLVGAPDSKGQSISAIQQLQTVKQRLGHTKKKEESGSKPLCRLSQQSSSSVLSRGPLSSGTSSGGPKSFSNDVRGHQEGSSGERSDIHHHSQGEKHHHHTDHPGKGGVRSVGSEGTKRTEPCSSHHPPPPHHPDAKGYLPGNMQRFQLTAKEDQLHQMWHGGSWPGGMVQPGAVGPGQMPLAEPTGCVDPSAGTIIPKEESVDEDVQVSQHRTNKSASTAADSVERSHRDLTRHIHEWTGHVSAMGASPSRGYAIGPGFTSHGMPGAGMSVEGGLGGAPPTSRQGPETVVKEERRADTTAEAHHRERASNLSYRSHEQDVQCSPDKPYQRQHHRDIQGGPYGSLLLSAPLVADGQTKCNASTVSQPDVKPVLVHGDHARCAPVQPVVAGTPSGGQPNRHSEAKEGNTSDETPSTSGSNIPVGIAIGRKRGDKRHATNTKPDEGRPGSDGAVSERARHRDGANVEAQRGTTRDSKNMAAKPGADIGPNLIVTGGAARTWREGDEPSPAGSNPNGVGAWLPPRTHPTPLAPPAMWLGQGGYPVPPSVDPAQLTPGGLKLAQDPLTGQVYVIPDVPLEAGRVWPPGFAPGSLQGQQLQYLQQQYAQHLQQLQQQQASGTLPGPRPDAVKTEAPCRQEEQAAASHYQRPPPKTDTVGGISGRVEPARVPHPHISPLKTSPPSQATPGESTENPAFSGVTAGSQQSGTEGGQNQPGARPFLVGLGQTFPGVPYPPHLPYYLDPSLLQQIRAGAATGVPVVSTTEVTPTSRTEPVTVQSRGCSPIIFPDETPTVLPVPPQAVTMVTAAVGTSDMLTRCTVGSQTSPSPVLELLQMCAKEEATQTSDAEDSGPKCVEVGVQLTPPGDSDSDSNCALTMPHLTARTIDCGTQADGGATYSSHCISSSRHYDSDRRSASPPPPALVAEGSPRHQPEAPPHLEQDQYGSSDHDSFRPNMAMLSSVTSSCHTTPTRTIPRGKGIFDLGIDFLNRQILEASDGLEMLSTLAERARTEQEGNNTNGDEQGDERLVVTTDTDEDETETDINKNYNAPKANMFMDTPSMYSFSSKFGSPSSKKDSYSRMASTFSYTEEQVDASQIEMRMKLADLQRKYKEKQRQLAKLQPRRDRDEDRHLVKRGPGRPRKRRFKKSSSSKSESPSKSPRSESSERPVCPAPPEQPPKKRKKDSLTADSKSSPFSVTPSKSKSKSSEGKSSSSRKLSIGEVSAGSSSRSEKAERSERSDKSSSRKKSSLSAGSSSGSKSSKSCSSKNKSSSSGSKSQSRKKDGKSSQPKKTKIKKEERDLDLEDSELEDVSWLFDEDEINPPPTVFAPSVMKKTMAKSMAQAESSSWTMQTSAGHEPHGSPAPPILGAVSSRSPYSYTESYDETSDEGSHGLLRFASSEMEVMRTSVAAATSAALKSKKRKKRPGGFGDPNDAPVKKRKPGRPKKYEYEHELTTGMTETIVDKKSKNLSLLHINTNTAGSSSGSISSSSSSSVSSVSSGGGLTTVATREQAETSPKKKVTPKPSTKEQKPAKSESSSIPFLEEEWRLRRSERIFLSDPNLNSPPLPNEMPDKALSVSQKKSDVADNAVATAAAAAPITPNRVSRPVKPTTPQTPVVTTVVTTSPSVSSPGGVLKGVKSSGSKMKAKVKTVHDLSQKVKKKYKKPIKPSVVKALHSSIKNEPMELSSNDPKVSGSKVSSSKVSGNGIKVKYEQVYTDSDSDSATSSDGDNVPLSAYVERAMTPEPRSCVVTKEALRDGLRVLIFMEGLFYEGQVKAIEPPDVYGVVIDGERGSRPHILSQEELLNEAVLDVQPASTRCLMDGTRVCAYWSQQFSCLYPGTVSRASPNPATDKHLVSVEFDDGDSGRIPIEHIRMLPHDYPVLTVGPNPILVLSKRRRRTVSEELMSDNKDRKQSGADALSGAAHPAEEVKQRRRSAKTPRRREEPEQPMPTIQEAHAMPETEPVDEYDAQREFGPDPPAPPPELVKEIIVKETKPKDSGKDVITTGSNSEQLQPPPVPASTSSKKKHKHKEKKKDRDKDRVKKSSSSGGGETEHKHKHHHHHHHHHKKHKHRKSSTDSAGSKSLPNTPLVGVGGGTIIGSFLSHTPAAGELLSQAASGSNNNATAADVSSVSAPVTHRLTTELSVNTSCTNMMVTATSPGGSGDKKLTMRIRTNSGDVHPMSPPHVGATADNGEHSIAKSTPAIAEKVATVTEKSHTEKAVTRAQDNYSEDDSPDTTTEDDDLDDDNDDDEDYLDGKTSSAKKKKSSMSARPGNKRRQTKRQTSVESKSKMAAFLPARQLWRWSGTSTRRPGMKGRAKKEFYKAITRGKEVIRVGDCAVFLSTGRPHLPYVGSIESLWEAWGGNMVVKVKWFYHPEETKGGKKLLEIKGALYQSPHVDENDVQTISHKCDLMRYTEYKMRAAGRRVADYDPEDVYYLAGTYEPTIGMITFEDDVLLLSDVKS